MAIPRDVALLLAATPPRQVRRKLQQAFSDEKAPPSKARRVAEPDCSKEASVDAALLEKLFNGVETVLMLLRSRRTHPTVAVVREHVGSFTQRDLSVQRLEEILAVADEMLETAWVGGALELVQRLESGEARAPSTEETLRRQAIFCTRLAEAAKQAGVHRAPLPRRALPCKQTAVQGLDASRPVAPRAPEASSVEQQPGQSRSRTEASVPRAAAPAATPSRQSASSRLQMLLQRTLAKQAQEGSRTAHQAKVRECEQRLGTCEDALALHAILVQLFARGEDASSAASEAEVLTGACSRGLVMQTRRPIDPPAAKAAFALLTAKADGWFTTTVPQHSQSTGLLLRRLPEGNSSVGAEALQAEIRHLHEERRALVLKGPDAVAEATVQRRRRCTRKTKGQPPTQQSEEKPEEEKAASSSSED